MDNNLNANNQQPDMNNRQPDMHNQQPYMNNQRPDMYNQQPYINNQRPDMYNQPYIPPQNPYNNGMEPPKTDGMAVASLVLGILSIVACCVPYISVVLAVIGVVLGAASKKKHTSGICTAGLVLSIIGLVLGASALILGFISSKRAYDYINESFFGNF